MDVATTAPETTARTDSQELEWKPWNRNLKRITCFYRTASGMERAAVGAMAPFARLTFAEAVKDVLPGLYKDGRVLTTKTIEKKAKKGKGKNRSEANSETLTDTAYIPRCYVCGEEAQDVDHLWGLRTYGDLMHNRAPICRRCNTAKGKKMPEDFLTADYLAKKRIGVAADDTLEHLLERVDAHRNKLQDELSKIELPADRAQRLATAEELLAQYRVYEQAYRLAIDCVLGHIVVSEDDYHKRGLTTKHAKVLSMLNERCANARTNVIDASRLQDTFERVMNSSESRKRCYDDLFKPAELVSNAEAPRQDADEDDDELG